MIIKVDHIAFSCSKIEVDKVIKNFPLHKKVFYERALLNIEAKKRLLRGNTPDHDIILLHHTGGGMPVEVTAYDKVSGEAKYGMKEQTVIAYTCNLKESSEFYAAIGFKLSGYNLFSLRTLMDENDLSLELVERQQAEKYYLDNQGFSALALITNSVSREKMKLEAKKVTTTDINRLIVNRRELQIFFAYSEYGDVVEYIEPCNRKVPL